MLPPYLHPCSPRAPDPSRRARLVGPARRGRSAAGPLLPAAGGLVPGRGLPGRPAGRRPTQERLGSLAAAETAGDATPYGLQHLLGRMAVRMHEIAVSQDGTQHALDNRVCEHQPQGRVHFQDLIVRIARRRENLLASVTEVVVHLFG